MHEICLTNTGVSPILYKMMLVFISTFFEERFELMNKLIEVGNIKTQSIIWATSKNVQNKPVKFEFILTCNDDSIEILFER